MSCEAEVTQILRLAGQKVTSQRVMILSALKHAGSHLTAAELYGKLDPVYASALDQSTVYRTLITAESLGLVTRFTSGRGDAEFEWREDDHHHLLCSHCGRAFRLEPMALTNLTEGARASSGFEVSVRHLAITGLCSECAEAAAGS